MGAATLASSIPLWVIGSNAHDQAVRAPDIRTSESEAARSQDYALATSVTLVAGGILLVSGALWLLLSPRQRSVSEASLWTSRPDTQSLRR
jgi:hypothetical protein